MIPQAKSAAVARGLNEAFGTTAIEGMPQITRGLSSDLVYRIVVKGSPYLLRVMTQMNERMDPERIFRCMRAASDAKITPHVHYAHAADGVSMTDFVVPVPLTVDQARQQLPQSIAKLHRIPPFPKAFNFVTAHNGFIWRFRTANILDAAEVEEAFRNYEHICAVYPRVEADMVSSHMDLKPDNILFDGERIWFVDWQAASLNDRYFDLAVVANFLVRDEVDEAEHLGSYFGRPATETERARFVVMRQALHLFAACVYLLFGSGGKPITDFRAREFRAFHDGIWSGEITMAESAPRIEYGLVHWRRFLENLRLPRFEESLKIIADSSVPRLFPSPPQSV